MKPQCNLCGSTEFRDFNGRPLAQCVGCGSMERTRLMGLYIDGLRLPAGAHILHIAPERGLYELLRQRKDIKEYTAADYSPSLYKFVECDKIDLCNLDNWPSNYYDLIIHSHVLEHIRCNVAYTLFHIHRMLKVGGRHMFVVPFSPGAYEESFRPMSKEERIKRFGQWDHLRRFGVEDIGDHLGKLLRLPESLNAEAQFGRVVLEQACIPESHWVGFNGTSVMTLRKDDYLLR